MIFDPVKFVASPLRHIAGWSNFDEVQQDLLKRFDRWRLVVRKGEADGGTVEVPHEALAGPSEPDGVQMLEKAHMESEDTFDLKVIRTRPSYAPTHVARRHEENCLSN